jgi:hypothetical protein
MPTTVTSKGQRQGTAPGKTAKGKAPRLHMAAIRQFDRTGPITVPPAFK